jgi:DNA primase catalytic subunit
MNEPIDLFTRYYKEVFNPEAVVIPDLKFRHFRFQVFSEGKFFLRLRDIVRSKRQLYQRISKIVPLNAYFTPVRWLNPIFVSRSRDELDVILFSALYFDVDSNALKPSSFEQAKLTTKHLVDYINCKYDKKPDLVVFSGRRGFHIYYWDWDTSKIRTMSPRIRIDSFIIERKRMLKELLAHGIIVDERVTVDPYRVMRIPNTLHGKTGLIARNISDTEKFDPLKEALSFEPEEYMKIMKINLHEYF